MENFFFVAYLLLAKKTDTPRAQDRRRGQGDCTAKSATKPHPRAKKFQQEKQQKTTQSERDKNDDQE